jgi:hypothetical protein
MMKEQIEEMEMTPLDVLANDINQHCPDLAENYCGDTHCVACLANAIYNAGYRKQEWISVDERLPESGVLCLLCCDVKRYDGTHRQYVCDGFHAERFKEECYSADDECVTEYNEETDGYYLHEGWYEEINNWDEYSSIAIDDTVTHWMPLPEAPKMKGGAE